jgi:hypothetical protein
MKELSDVWFKRCSIIEVLTMERVPPIEIHRRMQAVYGVLCVDVRTVKTLGKAVQRWRTGVSRIE